jgi:Fe-S-cluster containining protein
MDPIYFARVALLYEEINAHFPTSDGNLCGSCNMCCTSNASQGVTGLEFDYVEEFLLRAGRDAGKVDNFKNYIHKTEPPGPEGPRRCPLYNAETSGCSIYSARPLSCRTFGYFIREGNTGLIPPGCTLRERTVTYTDETFASLLPFAMPFYSLVYEYESLRRK